MDSFISSNHIRTQKGSPLRRVVAPRDAEKGGLLVGCRRRRGATNLVNRAALDCSLLVTLVLQLVAAAGYAAGRIAQDPSTRLCVPLLLHVAPNGVPICRATDHVLLRRRSHRTTKLGSFQEALATAHRADRRPGDARGCREPRAHVFWLARHDARELHAVRAPLHDAACVCHRGPALSMGACAVGGRHHRRVYAGDAWMCHDTYGADRNGARRSRRAGQRCDSCDRRATATLAGQQRACAWVVAGGTEAARIPNGVALVQ